MTNDDKETPLRQRGTILVAEAAELLGVTEQTAYKMARDGRLPVVRIGRNVRIKAEQFADMIGAQ